MGKIIQKNHFVIEVKLIIMENTFRTLKYKKFDK